MAPAITRLILSLVLVLSAPLFASQQFQQPVTPISGEVERSHEGKSDTKDKKETAVGTPTSINVVVSKKYDAISPTEQAATNEELSKWTDPITWFTFALVIANFALVGANILLWQAAKRQADLAELSAKASLEGFRSYRSTERAWVGQTDISGGKAIDVTDRETGQKSSGQFFILRWKNSGRTPALRCSLFANALAIDAAQEIPVFEPRQDRDRRETTVLPGGSGSSHRAYFTNEDIEKLRQKKIRIFLYGRADYDLVFPIDERPFTEVCIEVAYSGGTIGPAGDPDFRFTPVGPQNSAR
jgi:hypothetical protein